MSEDYKNKEEKGRTHMVSRFMRESLVDKKVLTSSEVVNEIAILPYLNIISVGGVLNAKKVGEMMSKKITPMNSGQGFTANLVTGLLVTTASIHGMPVSTTHVSVGSIFGIGTVTKKADLKVIKKILLSWLLTLPIASTIAALVYSGLVAIF